MDIYHYDYFVAKDHIAIYLRRPTRERVTTILLVSDPPELWGIKGAGFRQGETFAMVKVAKAMQLNTKDLEPMLNSLRRERGRDSKKFIRISIFDSYENETNCILPMMDPLFFYQRDTRPVGEMR